MRKLQTEKQAHFSLEMPLATMGNGSFSHLKCPDSRGEREFAEELEAHSEVVVYAKLPRSFKIPTPVGNYAPDRAIAFKEGAVRHVYFVAETKGAVEELDLRGVENAKISCARKLFNKINNSDVRYDSVDSYEKMLRIIGGLE